MEAALSSVAEPPDTADLKEDRLDDEEVEDDLVERESAEAPFAMEDLLLLLPVVELAEEALEPWLLAEDVEDGEWLEMDSLLTDPLRAIRLGLVSCYTQLIKLRG